MNKKLLLSYLITNAQYRTNFSNKLSYYINLFKKKNLELLAQIKPDNELNNFKYNLENINFNKYNKTK